jgi:hypothetical protein
VKTGTTVKTEEPPVMLFASQSLPAHLIRGAVGFGIIAAALALIPSIGWPALLALPAGLLALRGCPACWAIGLAQTITRGRIRRSCTNEACRMVHGSAR